MDAYSPSHPTDQDMELASDEEPSQNKLSHERKDNLISLTGPPISDTSSTRHKDFNKSDYSSSSHKRSCRSRSRSRDKRSNSKSHRSTSRQKRSRSKDRKHRRSSPTRRSRPAPWIHPLENDPPTPETATNTILPPTDLFLTIAQPRPMPPPPLHSNPVQWNANPASSFFPMQCPPPLMPFFNPNVPPPMTNLPPPPPPVPIGPKQHVLPSALHTIPLIPSKQSLPPPPPPPESQTNSSVDNLLETLLNKAGLKSDFKVDASPENKYLVSSPLKTINRILDSATNNFLSKVIKNDDEEQSSEFKHESPLPLPPSHNNNNNAIDSKREQEKAKLKVLATKNDRSLFTNKTEWQDRIALEVKCYLKPAFAAKKISKDDYLEIMKKTVTKISRSGMKRIDCDKIGKFVKAYIHRYRKLNKLKLKQEHKI